MAQILKSMNQTFSFKRFAHYAFSQISLNRKVYIFTPIGIFLLLFIIGLLLISSNSLTNSDNWFNFFIITGSIGVVLVTGTAFPFLRKKETAQHMLMLPASSLEKFIFEFLIKMLLFVALYVGLFQVLSSFLRFFGGFLFFRTHIADFNVLDIFSYNYGEEVQLIVSVSLFLSGLIFAGSAVFKKYALIKSIVIIGLFILVIIAYFYILVEFVHLERGLENTARFVFRNATDQKSIKNISIIVVVLTFISWAYAFFNIKEKEVY